MFLITSDPPVFKRNDTVYKSSGEKNVEIHLDLTPSPFPLPSKIRLEKDGQSIQDSHGLAVINGSVLQFDEIAIEHAGIYCLTATNYRLDNHNEIGTNRSCLTLEVICK